MGFTKRDYRRIETLEKQMAEITDRLPPRRLNAQQSITPIGHRWPYVVYTLNSTLVLGATRFYCSSSGNPVYAGSEIDVGVEVVDEFSSGRLERWNLIGRGTRRVTLVCAFDLLQSRESVSGPPWEYQEYFRRWFFQHNMLPIGFGGGRWQVDTGANYTSKFTNFQGLGIGAGYYNFTQDLPGSNEHIEQMNAQWMVGSTGSGSVEDLGFLLETNTGVNRFTLNANGEFEEWNLPSFNINAMTSPGPLLIIERLDTENRRTTSRKVEMEDAGPPP